MCIDCYRGMVVLKIRIDIVLFFWKMLVRLTFDIFVVCS